MMKLNTLPILSLVVMLFCLLAPHVEGSRAGALLDFLYGGGKVAVGQGTRAADQELIESGFKRFGIEATESALQQGGYALLRAKREFGDEVLAAAIRNPGCEGLLAVAPQESLRLVRTYGDDALRLENRIPGFFAHNSARLADGQMVQILRLAPEERLMAARIVQSADSPAAAQRLLREVEKDGPAVLFKIRDAVFFAGGVLTTAMLVEAFGPESPDGGSLVDYIFGTIMSSGGKLLAGVLGIGLGLLFLKQMLIAWAVRFFSLRLPLRK